MFIGVWYNIALCYYELKQYAQAVQHLGAIVEKGIKEYPGKIELLTNLLKESFFILFRIKYWYANRRYRHNISWKYEYFTRVNARRSI